MSPYVSYFGLLEKPFSITPDSRYLFLTKQYESALDSILYAIRERMGFTVLTGEVGTGKTTLSRELLNRLGDEIESALLINPLLSTAELLRAINKDFGIPIRNLSPQRLIESLNKFLLRRAEEGKNAVVIIDEAQNLSLEALEMIRMLTNLETEKAKLLQILLVGQPELMKKLNSFELRQLCQRIMVRNHLVPLKTVETIHYINYRLSVAGGENKIFFEPSAYKRIWRTSQGLPRLINTICDRSLTAAYVANTAVIDGSIVKKAVADLGYTQPRRRWFSLNFK